MSPADLPTRYVEPEGPDDAAPIICGPTLADALRVLAAIPTPVYWDASRHAWVPTGRARA